MGSRKTEEPGRDLAASIRRKSVVRVQHIDFSREQNGRINRIIAE